MISPPQPADEGRCDVDHGCITCGDVAMPLRVVLIDADRELALCENEGGLRETVEIALVQPVEVGEELLVHAGTAIAKTARTPGREAEAARDGAARGDGVVEGSR